MQTYTYIIVNISWKTYLSYSGCYQTAADFIFNTEKIQHNF